MDEDRERLKWLYDMLEELVRDAVRGHVCGEQADDLVEVYTIMGAVLRDIQRTEGRIHDQPPD